MQPCSPGFRAEDEMEMQVGIRVCHNGLPMNELRRKRHSRFSWQQSLYQVKHENGLEPIKKIQKK
jgi:hypothetical protein